MTITRTFLLGATALSLLSACSSPEPDSGLAAKRRALVVRSCANGERLARDPKTGRVWIIAKWNAWVGSPVYEADPSVLSAACPASDRRPA